MFGLPFSPEEKAARAAVLKAREADDPSVTHPSVWLPCDHSVHVFPDGGPDDWSVWLNAGDTDFTGLCIGSGPTRDEAVANAVASLEAVVAFLQGPPAPAV